MYISKYIYMYSHIRVEGCVACLEFIRKTSGSQRDREKEALRVTDLLVARREVECRNERTGVPEKKRDRRGVLRDSFLPLSSHRKIEKAQRTHQHFDFNYIHVY